MKPTPEAVFARLQHEPGAVWLDGPDGWSILAWAPAEVVQAPSAAGWVASGRGLLRQGARDGDAPFAGGIIGFVGYGAGAEVEAVPAGGETAEPRWYWARYEGALCHHAPTDTWRVTGRPDQRNRGLQALDKAVALPPPPPPPVPEAVRTVDQATYEAAIRRIQAYIAEGDCYQVNLSRPVHVDTRQDAFEAYRRLRAVSPAGQGAFLRLREDLAILSNSPELLLAADGRALLSRPIKGTRPRSVDPDEDARLAEELRASEKERAELAMIVDLVRNDLGRVAEPGTVRTAGRQLTAHANVHHASWDVSARLAEGRDALDALAAVFPPGSVIGAPKVRAAQRIAELEGEPRGVYCGAVTMVSDAGTLRASVAIRTAVWTPTSVRYHVGGGIVADSDPRAEWEETLHKGTALGQALAGHVTPELRPAAPASR
ncbi:MAG: aminodeoxychorismate/anthranilate synthase component I [Deltaproteobacteria bacterium]|nr:MAG: aminodeoxychorismate/anthranilate synthase component I [Deltaproteobacteria bacterium]